MKSRLLSTLVLGTFGMNLVGCGPLKNMAEMHDATLQMQSGMNESNAHQDKVQSDIDFATYATRQGATADLRGKFLNNMQDEPSIAGKLKYAAMFMYGFEFQVWTPTVADKNYREVLFTKAVEELVETVQSYWKDGDSTGATSLSPRINNLYALAATLHKMNPIQDEFVKNSNFPEYSMLNVITDGLRSMDDVKNNKVSLRSLPLYQQRIQQYSETFIFLLKLRYNFLAGFAWAHLNDGPPQTTAEQLAEILQHGLVTDKTDLAQKPKGFFAWLFRPFHVEAQKIEKWEPNWDNLPVAQVDRAAEIMEYSVATKQILLSLGQTAPDDTKIHNIFENMTWNAANALPTRDLQLKDCNRFQTQSRFQTALRAYLSGDVSKLPLPSVIEGWSGGSTDEVKDLCTGKTAAKHSSTNNASL